MLTSEWPEQLDWPVAMAIDGVVMRRRPALFSSLGRPNGGHGSLRPFNYRPHNAVWPATLQALPLPRRTGASSTRAAFRLDHLDFVWLSLSASFSLASDPALVGIIITVPMVIRRERSTAKKESCNLRAAALSWNAPIKSTPPLPRSFDESSCQPPEPPPSNGGQVGWLAIPIGRQDLH